MSEPMDEELRAQFKKGSGGEGADAPEAPHFSCACRECLAAENAALKLEVQRLVEGPPCPACRRNVPPGELVKEISGLRKMLSESEAKVVSLTAEKAAKPAREFFEGEFAECLACASKPGSPTLCERCLHNRSLVSSLKAKYTALEVELQERTRERDSLRKMLAESEAALVKARAEQVDRPTLCAFCLRPYNGDTRAGATEHVAMCPQHPLRDAERDNDRLRNAAQEAHCAEAQAQAAVAAYRIVLSDLAVSRGEKL